MPPRNEGLGRSFGSLTYARRGGKFDAQLKRWADKTSEDLEYIVLDAAWSVGEAIVGQTPFRSGRAKAHWRFGINSRPGSYEPALRGTIDQAMDPTPLNSYKAGDNIHIYNKAPYVALLEAGMSPQSPPGAMFRDHIRNWDLHLAEAARKNGI